MIELSILKNEIQNLNDTLIKIRHHLHENPELSMQEFQTTNFIVDTLKSFGINDVKTISNTGVVALINSSKKKCIALRADIDAPPICEASISTFSSKNKGISHMCGHDIHTTCLLGAAYILNKYKTKLDVSIKLIFQPGEEIGKGAKFMIEHKVLENPTPRAIIALHCWPGTKAGTIFHRSGQICASSDTFHITIKGKQGHAAHPYKAIDPIIIAGNLICGIQNLISREISPLESAVITLSSINSNSASNVIPEIVKISGSIRTLSSNIREFIHRRLFEVTEGISKTFRGEAEIKIIKGTPVLINDEKISNLIETVCQNVLGKENVIFNPFPSMGSEDFSYYLEKIPGAMYRLGCGFSNKENFSLHSNNFFPNEGCISTGVLTLVTIANNCFQI